MHIALHGRDQEFALTAGIGVFRLLRFEIRCEVGDRPLHHPRALHDLREEHFPRAKEIAHDLHAVH